MFFLAPQRVQLTVQITKRRFTIIEGDIVEDDESLTKTYIYKIFTNKFASDILMVLVIYISGKEATINTLNQHASPVLNVCDRASSILVAEEWTIH